MASNDTGWQIRGQSVPTGFEAANLTRNLAVSSNDQMFYEPPSDDEWDGQTIRICIDDPTFGVMVLGYMTLGYRADDEDSDQEQEAPPAGDPGQHDHPDAGATGGPSLSGPDHWSRPYDAVEEFLRREASGGLGTPWQEVVDELNRDWLKEYNEAALVNPYAAARESVGNILDVSGAAANVLESLGAGFQEMWQPWPSGAAPAHPARGLIRLVASKPGEKDPEHVPEREDPEYELERMLGVETPQQDLKHGQGIGIPRPLIPLPPVRSPSVRPELQPGPTPSSPAPAGASGPVSPRAPTANAGPASTGDEQLLPPKGFPDMSAFRRFGEAVKTSFARLGYHDVEPILQGSAVTGSRFRTGEPFDSGTPSDLDVAIVSPTLLARAKELGIPLRSRGTRTGPLHEDDLKKLGLTGTAEFLSKEVGREVKFMLFESAAAANTRSQSRSFGE